MESYDFVSCRLFQLFSHCYYEKILIACEARVNPLIWSDLIEIVHFVARVSCPTWQNCVFRQLLCDYFQIYFLAKHSSNSCCPTRKLYWVQAGIREAEVKWDLISDQSHKWPLSGNQWHALAAFFFQKTHVSVVSASKWENILPFIWQFPLPWLPGYLKLSRKCISSIFHEHPHVFHLYLCKYKSTC